MTVKYQEGNAEVVHKTAVGMFEAGVITKKEMEKFDEMCLAKEEINTSAKIQKLNPRQKTQKQTELKKAS